MKKVQIPFFLLCLVIACSAAVSGPSKEMISEVMQTVKSDCEKPTFGLVEGCRDYALKETKKILLTKADQANGISEKWQFQVDYLLKRVGKWEEVSDTVCGRIEGGKLKVYISLGHLPCN